MPPRVSETIGSLGRRTNDERVPRDLGNGGVTCGVIVRALLTYILKIPRPFKMALQLKFHIPLEKHELHSLLGVLDVQWPKMYWFENHMVLPLHTV
jgi:hypothetical protein